MNKIDLTKIGQVQDLNQDAVLELAMVMSTPANPEKPFMPFIEEVCETLIVSPTERPEYFEVAEQDEYVYQMTSAGVLTEKEKTVATTLEPTFIDLTSDLQTVTLRELNSCREGGASFFSKRVASMDRGLNLKEAGMLFDLIHAGATARSNVFDLDDSDISLGTLTRLDLTHITKAVEAIEDYGSNIVMFCGATVFRQLRDMAWVKDKNSGAYMDIFTFLKSQYDIQRIIPVKKKDTTLSYTFKNMNTSGATETVTDVMPVNRAYFVATDTVVGKPIGFMRKSQELFTGFGGYDATGNIISSNEATVSQRPLLICAPPMYDNDVTANVLKKGLVKYETVTMFSKNTYAFAELNLTR